MISTNTFQRPQLYLSHVSARPRRWQQTERVLTSLRQLRRKVTRQNLVDQLINASLIAIVGCSIAAALAVEAPMGVDDLQIGIPTAESRSVFDRPVFHASSRRPATLRLVGTVDAPIGQGWG